MTQANKLDTQENQAVLNIVARVIIENEPETTAEIPAVHVPNVPSDPTSEQQMRLIEISGTLDFWDRPEEDIYSLENGKPV